MTKPTKPRYQVVINDFEVIECATRAQANRVKWQFEDLGKKVVVLDLDNETPEDSKNGK